MNRRLFLRTLAAGLVAGLDPERALWRPGAKHISIPAPRSIYTVSDLLRESTQSLGGLFNPRTNVFSEYEQARALLAVNSMLERWHADMLERWHAEPLEYYRRRL